MTLQIELDDLIKEFVTEGRILKVKVIALSPVVCLTAPFTNKYRNNWQKKLETLAKRKRQALALKEFCRVVKQLDETSLCIDLGANVGKISEIFALTSAKVLSYEPDPWAFGKLKERLSKFENVELHEAAVGTESGEAILYRAPNFEKDREKLSLGASLAKGSNGENFSVKLYDVRQLLKNLGQPVDILKIDIEGAEIDMMNALINDDALLKKIRYVFVETHETFNEEFRLKTDKLRRKIELRKLVNINLDWV